MAESIPPTRPPPAIAEGHPPRPFGILVVDDESGVLALMEVWLHKQGFAVWLAANGPEALDIYQRHRETIDLVLMDVRMPGMDGPQTWAALHELNPDVVGWFMSGDLGQYTEDQLRAMGAVEILPKPFRLGEVVQVIRQKLKSLADSNYADE